MFVKQVFTLVVAVKASRILVELRVLLLLKQVDELRVLLLLKQVVMGSACNGLLDMSNVRGIS
jgi:hypothetical protein